MFFKQERKKVPPYRSESIFEAIEKSDLSEVENWLQYNEQLINATDWNSEEKNFINALDLAVKKGNLTIAKFLVEKGATISKTIFKKIPPTTQMAEVLKNVKFAKSGQPPLKPGSYQRYNSLSEVIDAAYKIENLDLLKQYIEYDPNSVNEKCGYSSTALEHAAFDGRPEVLQILLENDAVADKKVFIYAAYSGFDSQHNIQKLSILAKYGYAKNSTICTQALIHALEQNKNKGNLLVVEHILKNYAIEWNYSEVRTYHNITYSLAGIFLEHSIDAFELFCKYGKEKATDRIFPDGNTLMHWIASDLIEKKIQLKVLDILLQHNANPCIRHYTSNATAYQIARINNQHEIAERIKQYLQTLQDQGKIKKEDTVEQQDLAVKEFLNSKQVKSTTQPTAEFDISSQFYVKSKDLTLDKVLGQGGFGKVYLAKWFHVPVAVKMLKAEFSAATLKEFVGEANLFHKLRHKNIVQMYGICNEPGNYCIVMELLEKGSLFHVLHSSEVLDWDTRGKIILDVVRGLAYLHGNNVIHRDLKSLNVLLNAQMQAKLCDFGLSDVKQESSLTFTSTNQAVGTVPWMAPELFTKTPEYSFASDIYSLAMVFWEIATREIPWKKTHIGVLMGLILSGQREDQPPSDTPKFVTSLIKFCWEQDPKKRPMINEVVENIEINLGYKKI